MTSPPRADRLRTKLRVLPLVPKALRLDRRWQRGVPAAWPDVGAFLRQRTGHDFPVLSRLRHRRAIQSVASMLRENLEPDTTVVGLDRKVLAGIVFTEVVADEVLAADMRALAEHHGLNAADLDAAAVFARDGGGAPVVDPTTGALLLLARAAAPSPARIDDDVITACRTGGLSSEAIVELVTWLAVLQMLHRLGCFYDGR